MCKTQLFYVHTSHILCALTPLHSCTLPPVCTFVQLPLLFLFLFYIIYIILQIYTIYIIYYIIYYFIYYTLYILGALFIVHPLYNRLHLYSLKKYIIYIRVNIKKKHQPKKKRQDPDKKKSRPAKYINQYLHIIYHI